MGQQPLARVPKLVHICIICGQAYTVSIMAPVHVAATQVASANSSGAETSRRILLYSMINLLPTHFFLPLFLVGNRGCGKEGEHVEHLYYTLFKKSYALNGIYLVGFCLKQ